VQAPARGSLVGRGSVYLGGREVRVAARDEQGRAHHLRDGVRQDRLDRHPGSSDRCLPVKGAVRSVPRSGDGIGDRAPACARVPCRGPDQPDAVQPEAGGDRSVLRFGVRDRKSTRLNSSHVAISYAVFCLKKKKKKNKKTTLV